MRHLAFGAVLVGWSGCAGLGGSPQPRPAVPDDAALDAALGHQPEGCRPSLRATLSGQARQVATDGRPTAATSEACAGALSRTRTALRPEPSTRLGLVDRRVVDLTGISLQLGQATRCGTWPLRPVGFFVLNSASARAAGCRTRPWSGELPVYAYAEARTATDGTASLAKPVRIAVVSIDEGVARLDFGDLSRHAELAGFPSLWDFAWLELGEGGWAGAIDLMALRRIMAEYHFEWIRRGRGSPALFLAAHPESERAQDASGLVFEADLAAQERDYLAVSRGEMTPTQFLQRHLWSPYRTSVEQMAAEGLGGPPPAR